MIVYRLCRAAHAALDGEGARLWGGCWNMPGQAMVYTAASPSLAVLEILVHLDLPIDLMPDDMVMLTIDIPDDVVVRQLDVTHADDATCRAEGAAFLTAGDALALCVRSVVVPQEWNVLLAARHADMAGVRVLATEPFHLDPRLLA